MDVVVCFKVVPDEQDIMIRADRTLDFDRARPAISTYDLNAIEAAVQLVETYGGHVYALSVGDASIDDSKLKKNVLSRGVDELFLCADDCLAALDAHASAKALVAALGHVPAYDLIVCGEGSSDLYAGQVGAQLGQLLGLPTLSCVNALAYEEGKLLATRELENEVEEYEITLPALVSVTSDANLPRIASMKDILAAGKKPQTVFSAGDFTIDTTPSVEILDTRAPEETSRGHEILEGDEPDVIARFAAKLAEALR